MLETRTSRRLRRTPLAPVTSIRSGTGCQPHVTSHARLETPGDPSRASSPMLLLGEALNDDELLLGD